MSQHKPNTPSSRAAFARLFDDAPPKKPSDAAVAQAMDDLDAAIRASLPPAMLKELLELERRVGLYRTMGQQVPDPIAEPYIAILQSPEYDRALDLFAGMEESATKPLRPKAP